MSDCKSTIERIEELIEIPNSNFLELARIKGWQCVVKKGSFKVGDKCLYIPIDSVLPPEMEEKLFSNSKIKLNKGRIKTIKIRGAISQGLVVKLDDFMIRDTLEIGTDLTKSLGIKKYEPPEPIFNGFKSYNRPITKKAIHPKFDKYTDIQNIKNYPNLFKEDDIVIASEKIHGTNARFGWVPFHANSLFKKIKKFLGLAPKWEFVYGSHNVQLQNKPLNHKTYYESNIYAETALKYDLKNRIPKGYVIYGEIYGEGIQKNYNYGLKGERKLILFVIKKEEKYIDYTDFVELAMKMKLDIVPILYIGKFKDCNINELIGGESILCPEQKVREGCVIKTNKEEITYAGRKILKCINPEYLLKDNTEYH